VSCGDAFTKSAGDGALKMEENSTGPGRNPKKRISLIGEVGVDQKSGKIDT
jgi:hypothetical protein